MKKQFQLLLDPNKTAAEKQAFVKAWMQKNLGAQANQYSVQITNNVAVICNY